MAIVENVLWEALPQFLRKLDYSIQQHCSSRLPLDATPIKFSSWMGGDRDGNPFVTPATTFEVSMMSRWTAATLFKADIMKLSPELSLSLASDELLTYRKNAISVEPYRDVLRDLGKRLHETILWTEAELAGIPYITKSVAPLKDNSELLEPLMLLHRSLCQMGHEIIADGSLTDTIRRVKAFGLTLLPLDIRQESAKHSEALDAITRYLNVGSYLKWDESSRRVWLQQELSSKRPLLPRNKDLAKDLGFSENVVDTLGISSLISRLNVGSLNAYVISQCQQVSDILAVALLQQDAGVSTPLRVVPLFETLDDLERAPRIVDELFSIEVYRKRISGNQEIMIGYSDSAKDAGRLAASWAQYRAQESIIEVAKKHNIAITFFHGKGGTVGVSSCYYFFLFQ